MRVVLTGGTGFTGSRLVASLRDDGFEVVSLSRDVWNLSTEELPRAKLPATADAVVHLAQSPRYREFPAGMPDMVRVNVRATAELLDYAASAQVKSFVFTSTGSVYAASSRPLREDAPLDASGGYAASKLAAEKLCEPYRALFPVCVLRPFTIYGPGQTQMLMSALANRVREGRAIDLIGSAGGLKLTPTFVDDAVRAIRAAMEGAWNETVNLAGPETVSLRQIGETLGEILGVEPRFDHAEGTDASRCADGARLQELLGVDGFTGLRDGLSAVCSEPPGFR